MIIKCSEIYIIIQPYRHFHYHLLTMSDKFLGLQWSLKPCNDFPFHAAFVGEILMFQGHEVDDSIIDPKFHDYTPKKGPVFFKKPPPWKGRFVTLNMANKYARLAKACVYGDGTASLKWRGVHYHVVKGMNSWNKFYSKNRNFCFEIPKGTTLTCMG